MGCSSNATSKLAPPEKDITGNAVNLSTMLRYASEDKGRLPGREVFRCRLQNDNHQISLVLEESSDRQCLC